MQGTEELSYQRPGDDSNREQRSGVRDRRTGLDRRGVGLKSASQRHSERPYGFRDFDERRGRQDRRLYLGDEEVGLRRFVYLTPEELATLLSGIDD